MGKFSKIEKLIMFITFALSLIFVFYGQSKVGYFGLALEIIGVIGLIVLLYLYNRKFR